MQVSVYEKPKYCKKILRVDVYLSNMAELQPQQLMRILSIQLYDLWRNLSQTR